MSESISFDDVADTYDKTRAVPDRILRRLAHAIMAELKAVGASRLLEVGVGTGRIARPLARRGIRVVGLDIASRMLAKLREQLDAKHTPPDLIVADATALPIASASFRAAIAFHVLHLVAPREQALRELRRVLTPGGVFIRDDTEYAVGHWDASAAKWRELMTARAPGVPLRLGASQMREEFRSELRALGGTYRRVVFAEGEERRTPRENLERIRQRVDSWSWNIPDDVFADCLAAYEPWYESHYGDLDRELVTPVSYGLEVWTFG